MATSLKQLIADYLNEARLLQVATSRDNSPWVCTVFFAPDPQMNLYWISLPSRRHSQEIRTNSAVSGAIVVPHTFGDPVRGLQFEGTAREIGDPKHAKQALKHYAGRYKTPADRVDAIVKNTDGHVCYCVSPSSFVLFDEVNYPNEPRQKININS